MGILDDYEVNGHIFGVLEVLGGGLKNRFFSKNDPLFEKLAVKIVISTSLADPVFNVFARFCQDPEIKAY